MEIYRDDTGYIKGHQEKDGYWWVTEFVIHPNFRGKGNARILASHIPLKAKLFAYPLWNMKGPHLDHENLVKFYHSLGFRSETIDSSSHLIRD